MTIVRGNTNDGGAGTGSDGHCTIVSYTVTQSIAGNYSDVAWSYGVDYGDPNYWNSITNRSIAWTATVGASITGVAGFGTGTSSSPAINTSDPGYGGQIHYFWTGTARIFHDSNGHGTIRLNAAMTYPSPAYTSSITNLDIVLPNIPQIPTAPSALTATRISDTQINLGWTNNNTADRPYTSVKVYRSTDGGGYALIATLGVVTTYSDTGAAANHKYQYKVEGVNAAGATQSSASSAVWTTPGTPTTLVATKLAGGNIRLTWTNNVNYSEYTVRIEESQNGGAYAEITNVAAGTATWDHVSPNPAVTHKYRIRARTSSGTTLNSSYSNESATIVLLSTANPPSGLAPSGNTKDATEIIVFSWTHNPTDGTPQSKYQLQYKIDAGSFVTVGPTVSGVSSYSMPANVLTNAHTITWHVATAGENGTLSAYSADSVFTTQDRPTATISTPGATFGLSHLTAAWTYFQAQSSAQSTWHIYLWKKGALGDYSDATLVGEGSGSGATASFEFPTTLLDGQVYGVRAYVTSATGLESIDAGSPRQEFTVAYLPPADATLDVTYDPDFGRMIVAIQGTGASGGVTEPITTVDLQRQIDGGAWITWATEIVLNVGTLDAILLDTAPTIKGNNNYRAVIRSAVPSSKFSPEVDVDVAEPRWGFLSAGNNFGDVVRMRARLSNRETVGREKDVYHFAGRDKPVELSGEEVSLELAVTASLYPPSRGGLSSEPAEVKEIGRTQGIVLWRDYEGRRIFASLSPIVIDYNTDSVLYPVSFTLTETDYNEDVA